MQLRGKGIAMRPRSARLVLLAAVLVLALAGGCGGGGDRLSREELIEDADAICADFDQQIDDVEEPQSVEDIERYVQEIRPIVEEGTDELAELEPPEELEEEYDDWIAATRSGLGRFDELEEAAATGDEQRVQEALQGAGQGGDEANRLADEIGFEECGGDD